MHILSPSRLKKTGKARRRVSDPLGTKVDLVVLNTPFIISNRILSNASGINNNREVLLMGSAAIFTEEFEEVDLMSFRCKNIGVNVLLKCAY